MACDEAHVTLFVLTREEIEERVGERTRALQEELDWERQKRQHAEEERDRALEDLCALQQATKGRRHDYFD